MMQQEEAGGQAALRRLSQGALLVTVTFLALVSAPSASAASFTGNFEAGNLSEWLNVQAIPGRITVVQSPVAQGTYAGRFEVKAGDEEPQTGDERAEVISGEEFEESDVRYFRILSRVDSWDYSTWGLLWQVLDDDGGPPPLSLQLYDDKEGKPWLWLGHGNGLSEYWEAPLPAMKEWFELVIRVEFGEEGSLKVWLNGDPQTMLNEEVTYDEIDTLEDAPAYDKLGAYRSPSAVSTAVVYHDDYRVTESFFSDPPEPKSLFDADFEAGNLSEWLNVQAIPGRITVVQSPVAQGTYAGRFEVKAGDEEPQTGDERAEVISGEEFEESDVRYFRILSRVDSWDYSTWGLLWQVHDNTFGSPPLSLQLYDDKEGKPWLWLGHGNGLSEYWEAPLPAMKEWFELVIRVEFGEEGSLRVWLNGEPQTMLNESLVFDEADTLGEPPSYDKLGIYRSSSAVSTAVVFYDDYRITDEFFSDPPE